MSVLAVTTILHLFGGAGCRGHGPPDLARRADGLNILAGSPPWRRGVGMGIHARTPLSRWLLLGFLVTPIGLFITLGR